jgi:AcrR family transcriptional regulator
MDYHKKMATKNPPKAAKQSRTQQQRSQTTKSALVSAALQLFAARGFARTSTAEVLAKSGVTRGALYHHFKDKAELFAAVFEEQEMLLAAQVASAAHHKRDAWDAFCAGCEAFLVACLDPATQRIILMDAPAVMGWEAMRSIEARYALALLRGGLERAIADGKIRRRPVEPLAHFLLGALSESAMAIARAPKPKAAMADVQRELQRLLRALAVG